MDSDWYQAELGNICRFQGGDAFGREEQGRMVGSHPFIKVSDMNLNGNELYIRKANNWVSDEEAHGSYRLHPTGAVVFAKIGIALTYNRRRRLVRPTVIDNNMMSAVCGKNIDPIWFYYILTTLDFNLIASGTALPYLTVKDLSKIPITVAPLDEQQEIGSILGALDDKIDLNRRINETLETMARAIFKDWFVDFGPTRAKMEGRAPYLSPDVWTFFPDRLDDEGKPKGWKIGKLEDIGQNRSQTCQPDEIMPGTAYIALEHMPRRRIALSEWGKADNVESGKLLFRRGDFLFGKLRPYFHKVGVAPVDGVCTTDAVVINAKYPSWSSFVLMVISSDLFVEFTDQGSTGTKMPRTSWREMARFGFILPHERVATAFNVNVVPMVERLLSNIMESRTLAATRDLLLPKLMSGEIRIKDAEKMVETVL